MARRLLRAIADTAAVLAAGQRDACGRGRDADHLHLPRAHEGGQAIALDAEGVVAALRRGGRSGLVDLLDFELSNPPSTCAACASARASTRRALILSYHNFGYTPGSDFLVERFLEAERLGADVAKVAVMPRDRADVITLLAATAQAEAKARIPLISMSMGPLGAATRMVGGVFGSSLSFAIGEGARRRGRCPSPTSSPCSARSRAPRGES